MKKPRNVVLGAASVLVVILVAAFAIGLRPDRQPKTSTGLGRRIRD